MISERKIRVSELLKTLAIFFLTVLMLVLLLLLLLGQNENRGNRLLWENRMMIYESGAETPLFRGMEDERILPGTLLFCKSGNTDGEGFPLQIITDHSALKNSYIALYPFFREFLGDDAVCSVLSGDDGAALWGCCCSSEEFLYLSFSGQLPSAVIRSYTFSGDEAEDTEDILYEMTEGDHAYLKECFLISVNDVSAIVGRDGDGAVSVFCRKSDDAVFSEISGSFVCGHNTEISAYIETVEGLAGGGLVRGAFLAGYAPEGILCGEEFNQPLRLFGDEEHGTDTAVLFGGSVSGETLSFSGFSADRVFSAEYESLLQSLLRTVGMDYSDSENYYYDKEGSRVYLNSDGGLTVCTDGVLRYEALEHGGIRLSSFLGYTNVNDRYDLTEQLQASDRLVQSVTALFPELCACENAKTEDAEILLSGLQTLYGADAVHITYSFAYRGIPVLSDDGGMPEIGITVSDGWITAFHIPVFTVVPTGKTEVLLPQTAALRAMAFVSGVAGAGGVEPDEEKSAVNGVVKIGYILPENTGAENIEILPEWIFEGTGMEGADAA